MSVPFAAVTCHAPIVVPGVDGAESARCTATTRAMREIAERAVAHRPDRLVYGLAVLYDDAPPVYAIARAAMEAAVRHTRFTAPGGDGPPKVIVSDGSRRGLLLPDLEGVDTVAQQVDIARRKAGIPSGVPLKLQRFTVTKVAPP